MKKFYFAFAALAACALLASCNKENNNKVDDGRIDPSTVAQEALVAYFPFDGTAVEAVTGTKASKVGEGVAYTNGRRGQALQGAANGYLIFDLPNLNKIGSFSVSAWINQPTIKNDTPPVPCYLSFLNADNFWNDFAISIDRRDDDFLTYKLYWKSEATSTQETPYDVWKASNGSTAAEDGTVTFDWGTAYPANRWSHIVWSYDGATSEFHAYVNGVDVTPEAYVKTVANDNPAGEIKFHEFSQVLINGWRQVVLENATDEWMGWMNGSMDELRIYSKGLNAEEAKALYDAEVSQL